jgi:hypothetical protein
MREEDGLEHEGGEGTSQAPSEQYSDDEDVSAGDPLPVFADAVWSRCSSRTQGSVAA